MQEHRLALPCGYQLDHFRIESVLGKGGFGITYLAMDLRLGKRVAIKELLPDSIATRVEGYTVVPQSSSLADNWQWARERFLEEARVLAGFSHPAIVGVHLLMEAHGTVYMVMDYLEGESYEARLRRIGREPDQGALMSVMGPLLNGLEEVHAKGLLHRDIKPENILITSRGQPVLIDFGSARQSLGKTMTVTTIVTRGYSPIEQYQTKGRLGAWTDIYAMGAMMCRAMTGEKPPESTDRLIHDEFSWLSYRPLSGYNDGFKQTVDWGLRVKPEERPQSVRQWALQLNPHGAPGQPSATNNAYTAPALIPQQIAPPPALHSSHQASFPQHMHPAAVGGSEFIASAPRGQKSIVSAIILAALIIAVAVLAVAIGVIGPLMRSNPAKAPTVDATSEPQAVPFTPQDDQPPQSASSQKAQQQAQAALLEAQREAERLRQQQADAAAEQLAREQEEERQRLAAEEEAKRQQQAQQSVSQRGILSFSQALAGAQSGDSYAQAVLSIYYDLGYKTAKDPEKAVQYAVASARQGNPLGLYRVGVMLMEGEYISKDEAKGEAMKAQAVQGLVEMAKATDNPYAVTALGVLVYRGEAGLSSDLAQAARFYKIAADQGYAPAQYNLSACYVGGKGVPKNSDLHMKYWQEAYNQSYPIALEGPPR
jgi:serine/threonine protein kinase